MVSSDHLNLVYDIKLSSVGPGHVTGSDVVHEPSNMDLAMKLHYLREFISSEPMFTWLNHYYWTCGRFRRSNSGRPLIKCNDCGVRMIEAKCEKTIDEWLEMKDSSLTKLLVSNHIVGPELPFSPLVFLQVTSFKCGGMSLGLSWAHVLGDAFSASDFINMWGQAMANQLPQHPVDLPKSSSMLVKPANRSQLATDPLSIKRVDPVGDNWITANNCKMEPFSFHITATQLTELQAKISGHKATPPFECLCTIFWQSIARVSRHEPEVVTVCKMSVVVEELGIGERWRVSDFIIYRANLTFVNLEEASFYGLELNGQKPVHVSYLIDGIGDEGVVLMAPPGPKDSGKDSSEGRIVTVILPEDQVMELKSELKREWSIA
ncbi:hypothetical protein AAG906_013093 [Vitis piasezkii]